MLYVRAAEWADQVGVGGEMFNLSKLSSGRYMGMRVSARVHTPDGSVQMQAASLCTGH